MELFSEHGWPGGPKRSLVNSLSPVGFWLATKARRIERRGRPRPVLLTLPAHAGLMLGARETPVAADKHAASPAPPNFTPESRGVPSAEGAAEVPGSR